MSLEKTKWSLIPRKCSCGCNRRYFSPMWKVCVEARPCTSLATGQPTVHKEYEYYSIKEFPTVVDVPKRDIKISSNARLDTNYLISDDDWGLIRKKITRNEFLSLNYNIHVYPLSMNASLSASLYGEHYVVLCVQEIPEITAIGSNYTSASRILQEKLEQWFDNHSANQIPRPQEYNPKFNLREALKK